MIKIVIIEDNAYVEMNSPRKRSSYLLCIGSKAEVNEANEDQLMRLIYEAMAWSEYRSLESRTGLTFH